MSKNNTFIHIGCHKAGSTFLQAELLPKLKKVNHITFYKDGENFEKDFLYISQCADLYYDDKIEKKIVKNLQKFKNIFISSEGLSGTGYNVFTGGFLIKSIAQRLKNIFPDGKILIVIRNQKEAIESYYKDDVKYGFLGEFEPWFRWRSQTCHLNYFKYFQLVNTYQNIFGKKNVKILLFEKLFNIEYLKKKFSEIGLETDGINEVNFKKSYNETYSSLSLFITPIINRFFGSKLTHGVTFGRDDRIKFYNFWRYDLSKYFNKIPIKKTEFDFPDYENLLKANFHDNNKKLSKLIDTNLEQNGYL